MEQNCVSCGHSIKAIKGSLSFKCPACANVDITRCADCRVSGKIYICPGCGFTGP